MTIRSIFDWVEFDGVKNIRNLQPKLCTPNVEISDKYCFTEIISHLLGKSVQLERQIETSGLTVVDCIPPGAPTPFSSSQRPVLFPDRHVSVRTSAGCEGYKFSYGECIERQLKR